MYLFNSIWIGVKCMFADPARTRVCFKNRWVLHNSAFLHGCQCCNASMWRMYVRCMVAIDPQAGIVGNPLVSEAFLEIRLHLELRIYRYFCPFQNSQCMVFLRRECELWLQTMMPQNGRRQHAKSRNVVIPQAAMRFLHFPLVTKPGIDGFAAGFVQFSRRNKGRKGGGLRGFWSGLGAAWERFGIGRSRSTPA